MHRAIFAACVAVAVSSVSVQAQPNAPSYQRRSTRPSSGYYPGYAPRFVAPTVQGFSFQRPYPYHLDYYRKRYQGGYEPYLGNLYGPPAVVGTQPFAFSPYPNNQQPPVPPQGFAPPSAPTLACPHCQQPITLAPPPAEAPAASPVTN